MKLSLNKASITSVGIFIFFMAMYSVGTISSFLVSWTFTLLLLVLACSLVLINHVVLKGRYISSITVCWVILSALCFLGVMRGGSITVFGFYALCLLLLLSSEKIPYDDLYHSMRWVKFFGLFFAFGCYWQYLFPSQYYAYLYPLFGAGYQDIIRRQFTFHKMCTGFTSQTAVTAQFIILGLMVVLYVYNQRVTLRSKIVWIIELIFLFGALLLTGKRSPLLNLGAALIVVDMITVKRSKKASRLLEIILGVIVVMIVLSVIAPMFSESRNSIVRLFEYSFSSVEDIGEASNGRFTLYGYAISEFIRHPIFGIGWGKYSSLYDVAGTHNIYLQLLCECGVIGFLFAVASLVFALHKTIQMLKKPNNEDKIKALLKCSVFVQVYILVYGLFGNPLYDQNYILMYFSGLLIASVCYFATRKNTIKEFVR